MNIYRIKWENIFTIIMGSILLGMTIKYIIINGFNLDVIMFDLVYICVSIMLIRWWVKASRKYFLNN